MRADWFEAVGGRSLYVLVARLVNEAPLPPVKGPEQCLRKHTLDTVRTASAYFSAANIARGACYIPHAIAFGVGRYWPGLVTVLVIWAAHGLLVVVESYKRALCDHWAKTEYDDGCAEEAPRPVKPNALFRLRPFESERFYRAIGLEAFRRFVTWMMSTLTYGFSRRRMTYISQPSRNRAVAFELGTRVSESVHLGSALSVAPLVVFSWIAAPLGVALWSTVIVVGDVYLALLQRYHRVRVWPVIQRILERQS